MLQNFIASICSDASRVKPLNSGHLGILKNFSVLERCPLLGENLTKIVKFGTIAFCPLFNACPLFGMSAIERFHCNTRAASIFDLRGKKNICYRNLTDLEKKISSTWRELEAIRFYLLSSIKVARVVNMKWSLMDWLSL